MSNYYMNFYYDPQRQGFDASIWHTLYGSPVVDSGKLVINQSSNIHMADILRADVGFSLSIPSAPAGGHNRVWGLYSINRGSYVVFSISGTTFSAQTSDGTNTSSSTITWDSAWTSAYTEFRIKWEAGTAKFYVGGIQMAVITDVSVPGDPLSFYVKNENADNLRLNYINAKGIQSFYMNMDQDNASFGENLFRSDAINITESVTVVNALTETISVNDMVNITEGVTVAIAAAPSGSMSDQTNITESVTVTALALPDQSVSDQLNVTESVNVTLLDLINVNDTMNITEVKTVFPPA